MGNVCCTCAGSREEPNEDAKNMAMLVRSQELELNLLLIEEQKVQNINTATSIDDEVEEIEISAQSNNQNPLEFYQKGTQDAKIDSDDAEENVNESMDAEEVTPQKNQPNEDSVYYQPMDDSLDSEDLDDEDGE